MKREEKIDFIVTSGVQFTQQDLVACSDFELDERIRTIGAILLIENDREDYLHDREHDFLLN